VPVTPVIVNVAVVIVPASMVSLKDALIDVFTATSAALFAGLVDETSGGVVSGAVPVVNVQV